MSNTTETMIPSGRLEPLFWYRASWERELTFKPNLEWARGTVSRDPRRQYLPPPSVVKRRLLKAGISDFSQTWYRCQAQQVSEKRSNNARGSRLFGSDGGDGQSTETSGKGKKGTTVRERREEARRRREAEAAEAQAKIQRSLDADERRLREERMARTTAPLVCFEDAVHDRVPGPLKPSKEADVSDQDGDAENAGDGGLNADKSRADQLADDDSDGVVVTSRRKPAAKKARGKKSKAAADDGPDGDTASEGQGRSPRRRRSRSPRASITAAGTTDGGGLTATQAAQANPVSGNEDVAPNRALFPAAAPADAPPDPSRGTLPFGEPEDDQAGGSAGEAQALGYSGGESSETTQQQQQQLQNGTCQNCATMMGAVGATGAAMPQTAHHHYHYQVPPPPMPVPPGGYCYPPPQQQQQQNVAVDHQRPPLSTLGQTVVQGPPGSWRRCAGDADQLPSSLPQQPLYTAAPHQTYGAAFAPTAAHGDPMVPVMLAPSYFVPASALGGGHIPPASVPMQPHVSVRAARSSAPGPLELYNSFTPLRERLGDGDDRYQRPAVRPLANHAPSTPTNPPLSDQHIVLHQTPPDAAVHELRRRIDSEIQSEAARIARAAPSAVPAPAPLGVSRVSAPSVQHQPGQEDTSAWGTPSSRTAQLYGDLEASEAKRRAVKTREIQGRAHGIFADLQKLQARLTTDAEAASPTPATQSTRASVVAGPSSSTAVQPAALARDTTAGSIGGGTSSGQTDTSRRNSSVSFASPVVNGAGERPREVGEVFHSSLQ